MDRFKRLIAAVGFLAFLVTCPALAAGPQKEFRVFTTQTVADTETISYTVSDAQTHTAIYLMVITSSEVATATAEVKIYNLAENKEFLACDYSDITTEDTWVYVAGHLQLQQMM